MEDGEGSTRCTHATKLSVSLLPLPQIDNGMWWHHLGPYTGVSWHCDHQLLVSLLMASSGTLHRCITTLWPSAPTVSLDGIIWNPTPVYHDTVTISSYRLSWWHHLGPYTGVSRHCDHQLLPSLLMASSGTLHRCITTLWPSAPTVSLDGIIWDPTPVYHDTVTISSYRLSWWHHLGPYTGVSRHCDHQLLPSLLMASFGTLHRCITTLWPPAPSVSPDGIIWDPTPVYHDTVTISSYRLSWWHHLGPYTGVSRHCDHQLLVSLLMASSGTLHRSITTLWPPAPTVSLDGIIWDPTPVYHDTVTTSSYRLPWWHHLGPYTGVSRHCDHQLLMSLLMASSGTLHRCITTLWPSAPTVSLDGIIWDPTPVYHDTVTISSYRLSWWHHLGPYTGVSRHCDHQLLPSLLMASFGTLHRCITTLWPPAPSVSPDGIIWDPTPVYHDTVTISSYRLSWWHHLGPYTGVSRHCDHQLLVSLLMASSGTLHRSITTLWPPAPTVSLDGIIWDPTPVYHDTVTTSSYRLPWWHHLGPYTGVSRHCDHQLLMSLLMASSGTLHRCITTLWPSAPSVSLDGIIWDPTPVYHWAREYYRRWHTSWRVRGLSSYVSDTLDVRNHMVNIRPSRRYC